MTGRNSATATTGLSRCCVVCLLSVPLFQIITNMFHECEHVGTFVVASHVGVKILPCSFDFVVIGAIGRQEM